jgi:hypothetical protein
LAREDVQLDIEHRSCPCCGGPLHPIGETVSEMLDHVPARLRVIRIRRPRYGCRACGTDDEKRILAGHGRGEAAKTLGYPRYRRSGFRR